MDKEYLILQFRDLLIGLKKKYKELYAKQASETVKAQYRVRLNKEIQYIKLVLMLLEQTQWKVIDMDQEAVDFFERRFI